MTTDLHTHDFRRVRVGEPMVCVYPGCGAMPDINGVNRLKPPPHTHCFGVSAPNQCEYPGCGLWEADYTRALQDDLEHIRTSVKQELRALWAIPQLETEHVHVFTVKMRAFGHVGKTLPEAALALAIALHRIDPADDWELSVGGRRVVFDSWAQDGEHEGHENPMVIQEPH